MGDAMAQRFCTACGAAVPEGASFCGACGAPGPAAGPAQPAVAPPGAMQAGSPPTAAPADVPPQVAEPASIQPGGSAPAQNKWQKWIFLGVGLVFVLIGLRQFGIIGGPATRSSTAATSAAPLSTADPRLVGRWAPNNSCTEVTELAAGGVFTAPNRAIGFWRLEGDVFTLSGSGGSQTSRLVAVSPTSFTLEYPDGVRETQVRC